MLKILKPVPLLSFCFLLCLSTTGCTKKAGLEGLYPVQGKITLDGAPLEGATITFLPMEGGNRAASALSNAQGTFKVRTLLPDDGAAPGNYAVSVSKRVMEEGKQMTQEEALEASQKGRQIIVNTKETLPDRYTKAISSGISYTVVEGKNEELVIELTSK